MDNREELYRYEDILRAIGRYIDKNNIQDVILLQSENGFLLRGYRPAAAGRHGAAFIQYLFTPADLEAIDEEARQQRGTGSGLLS